MWDPYPTGMDYDFWQERWREGRLGFHEQHGNRHLRQHWRAFRDWWQPASAGPSRVLVPLCGKSQDMSFLAGQGLEVIGVEFVEAAVSAFFEEAGVVPERSEFEKGVRYSHGALSIVVGDFFDLEPADIGRIDCIYDRAALVAVPPASRPRYMGQLAQLSRSGAGLFAITFEHDLGSGPPFSVPDAGALLEPHFESQRHSALDILEDEPRFRERGASSFIEVVWFGRRH